MPFDEQILVLQSEYYSCSLKTVNMLLLLLCLMSSLDGLMSTSNVDLRAISKAEVKFTWDLLLEIGQGTTSHDKNFIFSPFSIYSCLLTAYVASHGETKKLLESFLRFDPHTIPNKKIIEELVLGNLYPPHSKEYELTSVERIYHTADLKIKKYFENKFKGKIAVYNISDEINDWVSQQTKGMIKEIMKKGEKPGPETSVFVNAAYFNGYWTYPMLGKEEKKPFTLSTRKKVDVLMMSTKGYFKSMKYESRHEKVIALPYKGDDMFMVVLVVEPKNKDTEGEKNIKALVDGSGKLNSSLFLPEIFSKLFAQKECSTDLSIPKFSATSHFDLIDTFKKMGGEDLFTEPFDLSTVFETGPLPVTQVLHTTTMNVYEKGTVAAAVTETQVTSMLTECEFHVNSPFAYFIYDYKKQIIHYAGLMMNPTLKEDH